MKNVLTSSKLSNTTKFVRRVLSRSSNVSKASTEETANKATKSKMKPSPEALELELTSLREQVSILQLAVGNMQEDAENREKALANLAREKQVLSTDLRKEKRSATCLKQQLDDERDYYYKEKEQYCHEMNDIKKFKKKISEVEFGMKDVAKEKPDDSPECKNQNIKLKEALNRTLQANYNLSVKFMRMKNTKMDMKNRLKKQEKDHQEAMQKLQVQIGNIKSNISDVVDKRFMLPISPSNKKYLQIIKQNGLLLHENLLLQIEVDRLTSEIDDLRSGGYHRYGDTSKTPSEPKHDNKLSKLSNKQRSKYTMTKPIKPLPISQPGAKIDYAETPNVRVRKKPNLKPPPDNEDVVKIYERLELPGIPEIIMLSQSDDHSATLLEEFEEEQKEDKHLKIVKKVELPQNEKNPNERSCFPLSQNSSQFGTDLSCFTVSREAIRTQSAPEIVQTALYVSDDKP